MTPEQRARIEGWVKGTVHPMAVNASDVAVLLADHARLTERLAAVELERDHARADRHKWASAWRCDGSIAKAAIARERPRAEQAEQENARLRAALESIVGDGHVRDSERPPVAVGLMKWARAVETAKAALSPAARHAGRPQARRSPTGVLGPVRVAEPGYRATTQRTTPPTVEGRGGRMSEWQPIETYHPATCPMSVLLSDGDSVTHGWWEDGRWAIGCEGHTRSSFTPTLWMPWPIPPEPQP